ncbi:MAG: ferrous iron transport protein [Bacteroidota bacterium]
MNLKVALIGNPNTGKTTIFNLLTGLRQKTANFPGVTVEKKIGRFILEGEHEITLIDLPGTYSVFPNSSDEKLVCNILTNPKNIDYPDFIIYVADINQLEKHMLLASQISDLGIPFFMILNMQDEFEKSGSTIDVNLFSTLAEIPVILTNARTDNTIEPIQKLILKYIEEGNEDFVSKKNYYTFTSAEQKISKEVSILLGNRNLYQSKLIAHHHNWLDHLKVADIIQIKLLIDEAGFEDIKMQIHETMNRYANIQGFISKCIKSKDSKEKSLTMKLDNILTNRYIGPLIFFTIMFVIFQSIFSWAEAPMTWIENGFSTLGSAIKKSMNESWFSALIVDGLLAGLSGVLVFIPQITLLFFFLSLLEESGYMSRVVYMFDNIMQKVGLNGRSMVALISSGACAIPAIMSTRTIGNWKERLITIMVSPLIPCSARIPVYTVLIALVIPIDHKLGVFNMQGIAFMSLYLLGIITALVVAFIMLKIIKIEERSYLMIELPQYKKPLWRNVIYEVKDKVLSFIIGAGKIIIMISIVLWFLASYGPGDGMKIAEETAKKEILQNESISGHEEAHIQSKKLEASYAGHLGKIIEPAIKPLGFDWKIGIALLTSFAAREVFVGTMATIYSIGADQEESSVRERMAKEYKVGTNKPMYDLPTALSLMVFYAFALQCMSTLAVTKKETNSWKWPIIQFTFMTLLAYLSSFVVYTIFK